MLINQEFINHLTPVEVSFIRIGIEKLYKEKVRPDIRVVSESCIGHMRSGTGMHGAGPFAFGYTAQEYPCGK